MAKISYRKLKNVFYRKKKLSLQKWISNLYNILLHWNITHQGTIFNSGNLQLIKNWPFWLSDCWDNASKFEMTTLYSFQLTLPSTLVGQVTFKPNLEHIWYRALTKDFSANNLTFFSQSRKSEEKSSVRKVEASLLFFSQFNGSCFLQRGLSSPSKDWWWNASDGSTRNWCI